MINVNYNTEQKNHNLVELLIKKHNSQRKEFQYKLQICKAFIRSQMCPINLQEQKMPIFPTTFNRQQEEQILDIKKRKKLNKRKKKLNKAYGTIQLSGQLQNIFLKIYQRNYQYNDVKKQLKSIKKRVDDFIKVQEILEKVIQDFSQVFRNYQKCQNQILEQIENLQMNDQQYPFFGQLISKNLNQCINFINQIFDVINSIKNPSIQIQKVLYFFKNEKYCKDINITKKQGDQLIKKTIIEITKDIYIKVSLILQQFIQKLNIFFQQNKLQFYQKIFIQYKQLQFINKIIQIANFNTQDIFSIYQQYSFNDSLSQMENTIENISTAIYSTSEEQAQKKKKKKKRQQYNYKQIEIHYEKPKNQFQQLIKQLLTCQFQKNDEIKFPVQFLDKIKQKIDK